MWRIKFHKQPLKELAKMLKEDRERVFKAIYALRKNPFDIYKLDIKNMKACRDWRLRVGKYRVIYRLLEAEIVIDVIKIAPRGDAYKD